MSEMIDELLADAGERMGKSVEATNDEFGSVRTGPRQPGAARPHRRRLLRRADAAQAARDDQRARGAAAHRSSRTTQSSIKAIEKAIIESDVGLTPNNDGKLIRLGDPRAQRGAPQASSSRSSAHIAEEGRIAIRNVRRDVMHDLRELKDAGEVGADDEHRAEVELQKLTDEQIAELDGLLKGKEAEILEV